MTRFVTLPLDNGENLPPSLSPLPPVFQVVAETKLTERSIQFARGICRGIGIYRALCYARRKRRKRFFYPSLYLILPLKISYLPIIPCDHLPGTRSYLGKLTYNDRDIPRAYVSPYSPFSSINQFPNHASMTKTMFPMFLPHRVTAPGQFSDQRRRKRRKKKKNAKKLSEDMEKGTAVYIRRGVNW